MLVTKVLPAEAWRRVMLLLSVFWGAKQGGVTQSVRSISPNNQGVQLCTPHLKMLR